MQLHLTKYEHAFISDTNIETACINCQRNMEVKSYIKTEK